MAHSRESIGDVFPVCPDIAVYVRRLTRESVLLPSNRSTAPVALECGLQ
jgi:hypothetical protein